jgi:tRNA1Val (adenine37-N6)-methyltransferase
MEDLQDEEYDLIVSNPPFYSENVTSGNESRDRARQNESLPFEDLGEAAGILLSENGVLAVILPFKEEARFIQIAAEHTLFPFKITRVQGSPKSEIKRSLLAFSRTPLPLEIDSLIIETERHQYTEAYRALTHDFYLNF